MPKVKFTKLRFLNFSFLHYTVCFSHKSEHLNDCNTWFCMSNVSLNQLASVKIFFWVHPCKVRCWQLETHIIAPRHINSSKYSNRAVSCSSNYSNRTFVVPLGNPSKILMHSWHLSAGVDLRLGTYIVHGLKLMIPMHIISSLWMWSASALRSRGMPQENFKKLEPLNWI